MVRLATVDDLEVLLPLVRRYREFYKQRHDAAGERSFIRDHLAKGTSVVFLAFDGGGSAIGFAQLFQTFSTVHLSSTIVLEDLFVVEDARRNGAASALLDAAIRHAREACASQLFLETAMDNSAAQRAYEHNGWTRENRFYKYNAPLGRD